LNRALIPIFLIVLVDVFGLTLVLPLQAIYAEHFGASPLQATLLVSVFAVCQLVASPLLGSWSDRIGRKSVLLFSQIGALFGYLTMASATSLWMIYVARVIQGTTAGNLSIAQAYIADHSEAKDRAKSFAIIGVAFGLGFFIGPAVTGMLVRYGLAAPIFVAAGMSGLSIVCTLLLLPGGVSMRATPPEGALPGGKRLSVLEWRSYLAYFDRPALAAMLMQFLFYSMCFTVFTSGFSLYAERRYTYDGHPFTPREIGYLFAYSGFLGLILQGGLMGRLVKRFGERGLVLSGFASLVVGFAIIAGTNTLWGLALSATVSGFGNAVLRPTLSSLISQSAARHEQGTVIGLTQSLQSVAQIVAPLLAGLLLERSLLWQWGAMAATAALVGLLIAPLGSQKAASAAQELASS
jgi:DHA1 family tetracycline resistance protein-like MFS transporter